MPHLLPFYLQFIGLSIQTKGSYTWITTVFYLYSAAPAKEFRVRYKYLFKLEGKLRITASILDKDIKQGQFKQLKLAI